MGIDLVFAGLMVLCLGPPDSEACAHDYQNQAWIVEGGLGKTCGKLNYHKTKLQIVFEVSQFHKLYSHEQLRCTGDKEITCTFDEPPKALKVESDRFYAYSDVDRTYLPSISQIDHRFYDWDLDKLSTFSATKIRFSASKIFAGRTTPDIYRPGDWYWINSEMTPVAGALANNIIARLESARKFTLEDDKGKIFLWLERESSNDYAPIIVRNVTKKLKTTIRRGGYEDLEYLLWYNLLGSSKDLNSCPGMFSSYSPVALRCKGPKDGKTCAWNNNAGSTMWPPMIK